MNVRSKLKGIARRGMVVLASVAMLATSQPITALAEAARSEQAVRQIVEEQNGTPTQSQLTGTSSETDSWLQNAPAVASEAPTATDDATADNAAAPATTAAPTTTAASTATDTAASTDAPATTAAPTTDAAATSTTAPTTDAAATSTDAPTTPVDTSDEVLDGSALTDETKLTEAPELKRDELNELTATVADAPGTADDKPEGDGTKIESISVKWLTPDTTNDGNPDRLSLAPSTDNKFDMSLQLDVAFSGQYDYDPGDLQISVPKNIVKNRDGSVAGVFELSVPEAPDSRAVFAYTDMGDHYVLTNVRKLSAATSAMFQFTIRQLTPHQLNGNPDAYVTDAFKASAQVITHEGNTLTKTSNAIDATFDTSEQIGSATNTAYSLSESWPESWPAELKPENPDDYVYVDWYACSTQYGNQAFDIGATHDVASEAVPGAKLLGISDQYGRVTANPDPSSTSQTVYPIATTTYETGGNRGFYTHAYAAYPKSELPDGGPYKLQDKVTYTLTSTDDKKVTKAEAPAEKYYSPMKFKDPVGHFNVSKYGGYTYGNALNELRAGRDVLADYSVQTVGFIAPWTWQDTDGDGKMSVDELGRKPVTMTMDDYLVQFDHQEEGLTAKDFEFESVTLDTSPDVYTYKKFDQPGYGYKDGGGSNPVQYGRIDGGEWGYGTESDRTLWPDVEVYAQLNDGDDWVHVATASWKTGSLVVTTENGATASGAAVTLPDNATNLRTTVTATNGGYDMTVTPKVRLRSTEATRERVEALFANSSEPSSILRNWAKMDATDSENNLIVSCGPKAADDNLDGAAMGARAYKRLTYENDTSNRQVKLHYTAGLNEQTNLSSRSAYDAAIEAGVFSAETGGTWYDLLPAGVVPDLSSIRATRSGDSIESAYTIENYRGSGRTLLVVRTALTPQPTYATNFGMAGYNDNPEIQFDAIYSWESLLDLGADPNNVVAFESDNDQLGTVEGLTGEPNDPTVGKNEGSAEATQGVEGLMTGLGDGRTTNSFVYAHAQDKLDVRISTNTGLSKRVAVNGSGTYSRGLEDDELNVYEGGVYSYRLRMQNDSKTRAKGIVIYDNLENYVPTNDKDDHGDTQWRGLLASVDVTPMKQMGVAPVVYYSTVKGLTLDETTDRSDNDLTNTAIWSTTPPADLSQVTAIAIDASKATDGSDYVIPGDEGLMAYVRMRAPHVTDASLAGPDAAQEQIDRWYDTTLSKDESEAGLAGGAHAFNNVVMIGTTIDAETGATSENQLICEGYTKVGLMPFSVRVEKSWDDDNDRDGLRRTSVTVHLLANGVDTGKSAALSADNGWQYEFTGVDAVDENGSAIRYTVREDEVTGYTGKVTQEVASGGITLKLANVHEPEKVSVTGTKTWDDNANAAGARPSSVRLDLYADGALLKSQTVTPPSGDANASSWSYAFNDLPKYRDQGVKINYEVRETVYYPGYVSSVTGDAASGYTVTNTYHPYGDLRIEKTVEHATTAAATKKFTFRVDITDKDGNPDGGTYAYEVRNAGVDEPVATGTITTGGTVSITGGQTVTIKDIPSESAYTVTEQATPGFSQTAVSGATGTIQAGETRVAVASFTNTYDASGTVQLKAHKTLTGTSLKAFQFRFELVGEDGTVLRTATNDVDGNVTFGALRYGLADVGQTFTYTIREVDLGKPGYTYDTAQHKVQVTVTDETGDGNLTVVAKNVDDAGAAGGDNATTPVEFANAYHAEGKLVMRAWKTLQGRDLTDDEFTFELTPGTASEGTTVPMPDVDKDGQPDATVTVGNKADGTITFPEIAFTEADAGKTYTYTAREVIPSAGEAGYDPTVNYTTATFTYTVTVKDNGDGTLSFDQTTDERPVFENTLKDGQLEIQKYVGEGDGNGDPNQEFQFHVELTGPDGQQLPSGEVEYERVPLTGAAAGDSTSAAAAEPVADPVAADAAEPAADAEPADVIDKQANSSPDVAPAAADLIASGNWGGAAWSIDADGNLVIKPQSGTEATVNNTSANYPWDNNRSSITTVSVEGKVHVAGDLPFMFYRCSSLTSLDLSGLDTSGVTNMSEMFYRCSSLASLDLSGLDTSGVTNMSEMFYRCSSLASLDLSGLDTSGVTNMSNMFSGCSSLASITLGEKFVSLSGTNLPSPWGAAYTRNWVRDDGKFSMSTSDLMAKWNSGGEYSAANMAGTYVWEKVPTEYTVAFSANEPAGAGTVSGSMANLTWSLGAPGKLPKAGYYLFGYQFDGWATSATGDVVYAADRLPLQLDKDLTATAGTTVTLYAHWTRLDNKVTVTDGGFDLTLHANEGAVFKGLPAGVGYNVYEKTPSGWVLVKSSGTTGSIPANGTATASFTNKYEPGQTTATIVASKTLDDAPAPAGYTFQLIDASGNMVRTQRNAAGGAIQFAQLTYKTAGTYTYTVREMAGGDTHITYDTHVAKVTVTVTDDGQGNLSAGVAYDDNDDGTTGDAVVFKNTTKEEAKGSLTVTKQVTGAPANSGASFGFRVEFDGGKTVETFSLRAGESKTFSNLAVGKSWTVTETSMPGGYTQTGIVQSDGGHGGAGTVVAGGTSVTVTNAYAASGLANVSATKTLKGGVLGDGQFSFALYASDAQGTIATDATPLEIATNASNGEVNFSALEYAATGTYWYVIREVAGSDSGVTYDTHDELVRVDVTDDGNGHLSAAVSYTGGLSGDASDGAAAFTNEVRPGVLTITKHVAAGAPDAAKGKTFGFVLALTGTDGAAFDEPVSYVVLGADGQQVGDAATVTSGGVITLADGQTARVTIPAGVRYLVTEQDAPGFTGTVTGGAALGQIAAGSTSSVEFTNAYESSGEYVVAATKRFTGGTLAEGQFQFALETVGAPGHDELVGTRYTVSNKADGSVTFPALAYTDADTGKTFVYRLSEVNDHQSGISYDDATVLVRVTPVDNGDGTMTVTATYEREGADGAGASAIASGASGWTFTNARVIAVPETGAGGIWAGTAAGLVAVLVSAGLILHRRRTA